MHWLLTLELIDSPVRTLVGITTAVLFVAVLMVRPARPKRIAIGALVGVVVLPLSVWLMQESNMFSGDLPRSLAPWIVLAGLVFGVALPLIFSRPWYRSVLATLLFLSSALLLGLAANASYAITHTPAAIFGVQALDAASLPAQSATAADIDLSTFKAQGHLPENGTVAALSGKARIPAPGYKPRDAAVYLPPAALVKNAPNLPVVVFMMGQPGTPDPTALANALDAFAKKHNGVAPIAVVVDQLAGDPYTDPVCVNSETYGAVSDYINVQVPAYIRSHFNVKTDPSEWTIGGYSNGGSCALAYASAFPDTWGNVLDVSGNRFPGSENEAKAIKNVFKGNSAAFEEAKPQAQLERHKGAYDGHVAVFTRGSSDKRFGPGQIENGKMLAKAGFEVREAVVPGAGHVGPALQQGLRLGVEAFGSVWIPKAHS